MQHRKMSWAEGLQDPEHRERTEKIIDIILMRYCEFVCTIDVPSRTVNFRFMSDDIHRIAPHWRQNVDMDFDENMRKPLAALVREEFREKMTRTFAIDYIVQKLNERTPHVETFDLVVGDGRVLRKQVQYFWIDDEKNEILCIQTDISAAYEQERHNEILQREASTDPLTSLPNRRGIRKILDDLAAQSAALGEPFCLAMSDIDFFKKVNDTYGHDAGDAVLRTIAAHMENFLAGKGRVGRMGGEEFLLVLENSSLPDSVSTLDALRQSIAALEIPYGNQILKITMTFGVAEYNPAGGIHAAITEADARLYEGKKGGRNRVIAE